MYVKGDMLRQLLVGGGVSVINIAIHALVMTILVWVARAVSAQNKSHPAVFLMAVMISAVSVLMAAHAVEVVVWSLAYLIVHAVPAGGNLVYFAFVNYTTLGYGDITPLTPTSRGLAVTEAILGQLYLAVLIARLVGTPGLRDEV